MDIPHRQDTWFNQEPQVQKSIPISGLVRMVLSFDPWQMVLDLRAMEITKQWIKAEIHRRTYEKYFTTDDLTHVFRIDRRYSLQVEPEWDNAPTPIIPSELLSREINSNSIQLQFSFLSFPSDLDELIMDLSTTKN